jgi:hypothetical protein
MSGKNCDFELRAYRSSNGGDIDLYAYSQHNHPFESNGKCIPKLHKYIIICGFHLIIVKRLLAISVTNLTPDDNPPSIFRTPDNIEWTFIRTLPDYDTLNKFGSENQSRFAASHEDRLRIRYYCTSRRFDHCKFMLLAVKTTERRFHVYSYGEHNHLVHNIKSEPTFTIFFD